MHLTDLCIGTYQASWLATAKESSLERRGFNEVIELFILATDVDVAKIALSRSKVVIIRGFPTRRSWLL